GARRRGHVPRRRRHPSRRRHPGRADGRRGDRRARGRRRASAPAGARGMSTAARAPLVGRATAPPHPALADARATTQRVARTFSLACRLLPRALRDDVYLLYLVLRTL